MDRFRLASALFGPVTSRRGDCRAGALTRHRPRPRDRAGRALAQNDHAENLVLGHILDPAAADDLAVLHHGHAVGEVEHVVDVVADEEDADALGLELLDELADLRVSAGPSAAVGSSKMRMRALKWIARAMATD